MSFVVTPLWPPAWRAVVDLVYPPHCALCDKPIDQGALALCNLHLAALAEIGRYGYCPRCGQTRGPYAVSENRCSRCPRRGLSFSRVVRAFPYRDPVRSLIHGFKYQRQIHMDAMLAHLIWDAVVRSGSAEQIDGFVSIPLHWSRYVKRGFNQSSLLARAVARLAQRPIWELASRSEYRPAQTAIARSGRWNNVRGIFQIEPTKQFVGKTVCIVDDVLTTGATASELAKVLHRRGAYAVITGVIAVAETPGA